MPWGVIPVVFIAVLITLQSSSSRHDVSKESISTLTAEDSTSVLVKESIAMVHMLSSRLCTKNHFFSKTTKDIVNELDGGNKKGSLIKTYSDSNSHDGLFQKL